MAKPNKFTEVKIDDVILEIEYSVYGSYIPASREEPEEHPEYVIEKIMIQGSDQNCTDLLIHLDEEIVNYIREYSHE